MELSPVFSGMNSSVSGMTAERKRMNAIAENLANAETTRTEEGGPYKRQHVVFSEEKNFSSSLTESIHNKLSREEPFHLSGTEITSQRLRTGSVKADVVRDESDFRLVYDPEHPEADESGMVKMPNVDIVQEMTELISASRAFEANVTAFNATKQMMKKALEL